MGHESPYMTAREAAAYLRIENEDGSPNVKAFYAFRYRHRLRAHKRGGRLLFVRADLDAATDREGAALDRFLAAKRGKVA